MQYNILQYFRLTIQCIAILKMDNKYIAILQVNSTIYCIALNGHYIVLSTLYCYNVSHMEYTVYSDITEQHTYYEHTIIPYNIL
jgi:hypothetical protein